MKKQKRIFITSIICFALISAFTLFSVVTFSSDNDPLITLSYLREIIIPELKNDIINTVQSSQQQPEPEQDTNSDLLQQITGDTQTSQSQNIGTYELLELTYGQTVMANSICEFIVRPGSIVTTVSPFEEQGIADITNGIEVFDGYDIAINAYCIIPRGSDGRGLKVYSDKAYIMIRGDYTIG